MSTTDSTLIPFDTGTTGSNALSAGIGAFVGSWFGNGWNGFGNRNTNGLVTEAATTSAIDNSMVLDGLSNISGQLNTVNSTLLSSQASQNMAMAQGFSGLNTALYQTNASTARDMGTGFNAVADAVTRTSGEQRLENMSNFNNVVSSINQFSNQSQLGMANGFGNLAYENAQNTCSIKSAIHDDGSATRALIEQNYINELQSQLCDAKSKVSSLEAQQYTNSLISNQSTVFDAKLNAAVATIIGALKVSGT